ncbi:hypothetical protein NQZ68_005090 [Dissostichus eleginoides]|nr:hypothetical protein NQZ68_005090 [Dissostichus eleginoides]
MERREDRNQSTSSSNLEAIAVCVVGNSGQKVDRSKTRKTDEMKGRGLAGWEGDMDKEKENIEGDRRAANVSGRDPVLGQISAD